MAPARRNHFEHLHNADEAREKVQARSPAQSHKRGRGAGDKEEDLSVFTKDAWVNMELKGHISSYLLLSKKIG